LLQLLSRDLFIHHRRNVNVHIELLCREILVIWFSSMYILLCGLLLNHDGRIFLVDMFIMSCGSLPNGNGINHLCVLRCWNLSGLDGIKWGMR